MKPQSTSWPTSERLFFSFLSILIFGCASKPTPAPPIEPPGPALAPVEESPLSLDSTPQRLEGGGLTLHLTPRPESGLIAVQLWLRAGSRDELDGERGAAVTLQNLIVGHPEQPQTLAGEIAALGGEARGWTSIDRSVFELISKHFG